MLEFYHSSAGRIKSFCEKKLFGRPAGIWFVIAVLTLWTLLKSMDIYSVFFGQAGMVSLFSFLVIVPANIVCLKGLLSYNLKIYNFTLYWLWAAYMISVLLLPQYIHHDERWETFLAMAIIMSPVLISWFILKIESIRKLYESGEGLT
jgi:hypothetical protein